MLSIVDIMLDTLDTVPEAVSIDASRNGDTAGLGWGIYEDTAALGKMT